MAKPKAEGKTLIVRGPGKTEMVHEPDCNCGNLFRASHGKKDRGLIMIAFDYEPGTFNVEKMAWGFSNAGCPANKTDLMLRAVSDMVVGTEVLEMACSEFHRRERDGDENLKKRAPRGSKRGLK